MRFGDKDLKSLSYTKSASPQQQHGPGEKYIHAFGKLEATIREILRSPETTLLGQLLVDLERAAPSTRQTIRVIRELKNVRNLIAHGAERIGRVLPTIETFDALEKCQHDLEFFTDGVRIFLKPVREFSNVEPLSDALRFMHSNDFSQIVVRQQDGRMNVLTAIDMADWLTGKIEDDVIQLSDHKIGDVVSDRRSRRFIVLSQSSSVGDVQIAFSRAVHQDYDNLFCVVLTPSGRASEKALGIVTPWDLIHGSDSGAHKRR